MRDSCVIPHTISKQAHVYELVNIFTIIKMLLFKILACILFAYAGMSSAKNCKTQGKRSVTCRSCPASVCAAKFTNKPGREYNLGCKAREGERIAKNA